MEEVKQFISGKENVIYTEFLKPNQQFGKISNKIHTLRVITMNKDGNNPQIVDGASIRFSPSDKEGSNLIHFNSMTSNSAYNLYSHLNLNTGEIEETKVVGLTECEYTNVNPATDVPMQAKIENISVLKETILGIASFFFGIEWMGFDLCISDKGVKIMEINSHPGVNSAQLFQSLYYDSRVEKYLKDKLSEINNLSESDSLKRNALLR